MSSQRFSKGQSKKNSNNQLGKADGANIQSVTTLGEKLLSAAEQGLPSTSTGNWDRGKIRSITVMHAIVAISRSNQCNNNSERDC